MNNWKTSVSTIALMTALLGSSMAGAQEAKAAEDKKFNVTAQSLPKALQDFAKQAGIQIIYSHDLLNSMTSEGVSGKLTTIEGLKKILSKSGMTFEKMDDNSFVVKKAKAKKQKLSFNDTTSVSPKSSVSNAPSSDGQASLSGHVTEMNSGGNLPGALVRIIETGQTAITDALGNFRFPSVTPGNYTLSISYLGFASRISEITLERAEDLEEEYSLGKALGDLDEIVVFGTRSARALALNLQRTAENNSEVISADMLGNFTGTTISEALRRVSGVAFQRDPSTGDGTNIYIRGLAPEMNTVKLNGLILPVSQGKGRTNNLSNILADSVAKITIHKSLLPSHDSQGTGGLVEIETKSPLNRPHRYVNLSAEGDFKGSGFGNGVLLSGTVAGTFGGDENFGLSASVQYRKRDIKTFSYEGTPGFAEYLPLNTDNALSITKLGEVNPFLNFPFEPGADGVFVNSLSNTLQQTDSSNLAITLSAEWQVDDHTNLKLDYQRSTSKRSAYSRSTEFQTPLSYIPTPVAALGGEERWALGWGGTALMRQSYGIGGSEDITDNYSLRGRTTARKWEFNYTLGYTHGSRSNDAGIRLNSAYDEALLDPSFIAAAATDSVEGRIISPFGRRMGNEYPLPLLTDEGWAFVNDPANYTIRGGGIEDVNAGYNNRYTAKFSSRYDVDGKHLKYVEVGVEYEDAKFGSRVLSPVKRFGRPAVCPPFDYLCSLYPEYFAVSPPIAMDELGFSFEEANLAAIGIDGPGFSVVTRSDVEGFFASLPGLVESGELELADVSAFEIRNLDAFTREKSLSAYLQARIDIGKLEIIGGVRINRVNVNSFKLNAPNVVDENGVTDIAFGAQFEQLDELKGQGTDVLPRFQFNYRENDNLVFRASYYLSVARPSIEQLSENRSISLVLDRSFSLENVPTLGISEGNPDLKPANTHNFDASIEYYADDIGLIKLSGFYKRTTNQLESSFGGFDTPELDELTLPDHEYFQNLPDDLVIRRFRPQNSDDPATIWGFEAHIERRFNFLPGIWNGLGIFANYSFTKSSKTGSYTWFGSPVLNPDGSFKPLDPNDPDSLIERGYEDFEFESVSYNGAPRHSGTVALTYNKHDIDAALTYSFQGRFTNQFTAYNLGNLSGGGDTLDFRISYYFDLGRGHYRVFFEGIDLMRSSGSPDLESIIGGTDGTPQIHAGASYFGGRSLKLGLSVSF